MFIAVKCRPKYICTITHVCEYQKPCKEGKKILFYQQQQQQKNNEREKKTCIRTPTKVAVMLLPVVTSSFPFLFYFFALHRIHSSAKMNIFVSFVAFLVFIYLIDVCMCIGKMRLPCDRIYAFYFFYSQSV